MEKNIREITKQFKERLGEDGYEALIHILIAHYVRVEVQAEEKVKKIFREKLFSIESEGEYEVLKDGIKIYWDRKPNTVLFHSFGDLENIREAIEWIVKYNLKPVSKLKDNK